MARKISMKTAINEAIDQEMARDPSVIMMGEDIVGGAGGQGERDAWGGVLGQITFRPGMCVNSGVSICECCAAARKPAPTMARITTGVSALPPNM